MDNNAPSPSETPGSPASSTTSAEPFGESVPVDLPAPQIVDDAAPAGEPSPDATAKIGAELLDVGCGLLFASPLEPDERAAFERDLLAVLEKHNVPNLPFAEELQLATTTAKIVIPRVLGGGDDGRNQRGQEGERQERAHSQAGLPATLAGSAVADLLSRS